MAWPWARCGAMQYLHRGGGPVPDWLCVVPPIYDRPPWVPAHATSVLLDDGDVAYLWHTTPHDLTSSGGA